MSEPLPAGVILAGGRSRRMGVSVKALVQMNGKPLVRHVAERLQPQVSEICLSVERFNPELAALGLEQVEDTVPGNQGPLGGLLAAMEALHDVHEWLLLVPCDAPFLPPNLGERLARRTDYSGLKGCLVRYDGELQPTFSLWHRELLPDVRTAVMEDGLGGFRQFLGCACLSIEDWKTEEVSPFFNVNTPGDLEEAAAIEARGFAAPAVHST